MIDGINQLPAPTYFYQSDIKLVTRPGKRLQKTDWKDPLCY